MITEPLLDPLAFVCFANDSERRRERGGGGEGGRGRDERED